jgi:hypothetical protein
MIRTGWSLLFADDTAEKIHRSRSTENGLAPGTQVSMLNKKNLYFFVTEAAAE